MFAQIVPEFEIISTDAEEGTCLLPWQTVMSNAISKNKEVGTAADIVVSADTGVFLRWKFFGKPESREEAFAMLKKLNNRRHSVWTGVSVRYTVGNKTCIQTVAVRSTVKLNFADDKAIWDYVNTGSPMDKAGAYGIQDEIGATYTGSLTNIIGLPVEQTRNLVMRAISAVKAGGRK